MSSVFLQIFITRYFFSYWSKCSKLYCLYTIKKSYVSLNFILLYVIYFLNYYIHYIIFMCKNIVERFIIINTSNNLVNISPAYLVNISQIHLIFFNILSFRTLKKIYLIWHTCLLNNKYCIFHRDFSKIMKLDATGLSFIYFHYLIRNVCYCQSYIMINCLTF